MLSYFILSVVAGLLLVGFILIVRFLGQDDGAASCSKPKSCPHLLTMSTPVTLSLTEVQEAGLQDTILQFTSSAKHTKLDGMDCVELNIPDLLNVLVQKCSQHEREIGDIVALLSKKGKKKVATKVAISKNKK